MQTYYRVDYTVQSLIILPSEGKSPTFSDEQILVEKAEKKNASALEKTERFSTTTSSPMTNWFEKISPRNVKIPYVTEWGVTGVVHCWRKG